MKKYKTKWSEILTKEFLIKQYTNLKKSTRDIAKENKCGKTTIFKYLNDFNIPTRTQSEAMNMEETRQKMSENHADFSGGNHPRFKGRIKNGKGYILIHSPNHSFRNSNNDVLEQRLIVESQIGRLLDPKWVVHHINGIKDDNRPENLICFTSESAHQRFHKDSNNVKSEEIIFDGRKFI